MTKKIKCPHQKWFIRLSEGNVSQDQEEKLSLHLEECVRCQTLVDKLNDISEYKPDTVGNDFNAINTDSDKLRQRLSEIKSEVPSVSSTSGYMDVMPWLSSSENGLARIDEFELQKFVGRGGMGVVFRCLDTKLQRPVALKLMSPQLLVDEAACERFLREARSAAKINHPNVVTVHAVNETQGLPYLVMELIEGDSLESMLVKDDSLSFKSVVEIARQSIAGLSAAHRHGVLHRDIKPANIMLDSRTGHAKITDFGLACSMEGSKLTRTGFLVGTPEYLSPEQASGEKIDERSDLFSMGSVIYAMCCGTSPFSSSSMLTTLDKVRSQQPRSLQELNPNLPVWFVAIIEKLLNKNPDSRFESAVETLAAINSNLTDSNDTVPQIDLSSTRKIVQQKHQLQNKFLLSVGLFAVATSLLMATVFWYFYSKKQQVRTTINAPEQPTQKDEQAEIDNELPGIELENLKSGDSVVISNFNQLAAAVEFPTDQLNLLIESGTHLDLSHCLEIEDKKVSITTTDDEPAFIDVELWKDSAFRVSSGSLRIENIEISSMFGDGDMDEDEFVPLMYCEDSNIEIDHSTIVCHDLTPCIELEDSIATISNSQVVSKDAAILWIPKQNSQKLTIDNSFIASPFAISSSSRNQINLSMKASTLISESCIVVNFEDVEKNMIFNVENCILFSSESVIDIDEIETEDDDWVLDDVLGLIEFSGSNNRISRVLMGGIINDKEQFIDTDFEGLNHENENNQLFELDLGDDFEIEDVIANFLDGEFEILKEFDVGDGIGATIESTGPR